MKLFRFIFGLTLLMLIFTQCKKEEFEDPTLKRGKLPDVVPAKMFTVTVENVSTPYLFFESGVASIPEGASGPGPAHPGESFKFSFHAGPSHKLSFATMYGFSNDGFYAPDTSGISLYSGTTPITGDITSQVLLWDAGTEMNQMPGPGNMHDGADTDDPVQLMSSVADGYDYGMVNTNLKVTLEYDGDHMFTVTIDNLETTTTGISPVAWVVHSAAKPLFETEMNDYGKGLENIAESGDTGPLGDYLAWNSGYVSPIAPMIWVVHEKGDMPVFTNGSPDRALGLKSLAETGIPAELYGNLMMDYNTGVGGTGPIFPGGSYSFSFDAKPNQYLSIASMLGNSNDEFFAFGDSGIKLAFGNHPQDITDEVMLWDAGTSINQYPGTKTENVVEGGNVRILNDGYPWPAASNVIKITIHKN